MSGEKRLRVGYFSTMGLGHKTTYLNVRRAIEVMKPAIDPVWFEIPTEAEDPWLKRLPLVTRNLRRNLSDWLEVGRGLSRGPFDAVVFDPHGFAVKEQRRLKKIPSFLILDATRRQLEAFGWYLRPSRYGWLRREQHRRQVRAFRVARGLFPNSQWAARSLVEEYEVDPAKIFVMPVGIDVDRFVPPAQPRPLGERVKLLFVGGDFQRKGGDLLLKWARETKREDWELDLVTRPSSFEHPRVRFHQASNNSDALLRRYQAADAFVLPTRADCSPIVVLEAMASGLPVLATRVGGVTELVDEDATGHVVEPDSYESLCAGLDRLLDARARYAEMGQAGRAKAVAGYSCVQIVQRGLEVIQRLCG